MHFNGAYQRETDRLKASCQGTIRSIVIFRKERKKAVAKTSEDLTWNESEVLSSSQTYTEVQLSSGHEADLRDWRTIAPLSVKREAGHKEHAHLQASVETEFATLSNVLLYICVIS